MMEGKQIKLIFKNTVVTLTTNMPEFVCKLYSEKFGKLLKVTCGFKEIVDYIKKYDEELKIIVNSMVSVKGVC